MSIGVGVSIMVPHKLAKMWCHTDTYNREQNGSGLPTGSATPIGEVASRGNVQEPGGPQDSKRCLQRAKHPSSEKRWRSNGAPTVIPTEAKHKVPSSNSKSNEAPH